SEVACTDRCLAWRMTAAICCKADTLGVKRQKRVRRFRGAASVIEEHASCGQNSLDPYWETNWRAE
ncbi:MAG: hypothetical protein KJN92_00760, partial [Gemmatimonadetes bacterium]|nr:hypothetical protein [Gemmatimonadota bacterium]